MFWVLLMTTNPLFAAQVSPEDWKAVVALSATILGVIGGVYTVPLINRLKDLFHISGNRVVVLTVTVSGILGVLSVIVSGAILPGTISWAYLVQVITIVFLASQAQYHRITRELENDNVQQR